MVWVPYATLALIPTTTGLMSIYHYAGKPSASTGHCFLTIVRLSWPRRAAGRTKLGRGYLFYTWTGVLSLPLSMVMLGMAPYVYVTDWEQRQLFADVMNLWAQVQLCSK